jgi:rubrerythrin
MSTAQNLKDAFAGESQANRRYTAFARKAESEGFPQIAKLFRAAADGETIHALAHFRVMGGVKSTAENLQGAMDGESYEFTTMYPAFIKEADTEANKAASNSFDNAFDVEKVHFAMYKAALEAAKAGKDLPSAAIFICPVCGNIEYGAAPAKCPVCSTPGAKWTEVK